jgi:O-methyltransferase
MLNLIRRLQRWHRAAWIIESFRDVAIAAMDRDGRFTHLNSAAVDLLRRQANGIIGKTILEVLPAGDGAKLFDHLQNALRNPTPVHFEEYFDQLKIWCAFACYPIEDGLACHFSDITKAKRQEAERRRQEEERRKQEEERRRQEEERKRRELLRPLPLWNEDGEFTQIFSKIDYTLVDHARCYILYQLAKRAAEIPGDLAEVGVYKGGTAKLLALTIAPRATKTLHLFDTFTGMPPVEADTDRHSQGDLGDTSLEAVQRTLQGCENVQIYQGFFPDTAGPIENSRFCLVHIDADIYQSVKDSCEFFYPRLEKNGIMVFDDYGFRSCPGARKAVDEFFSDKPEYPLYLPSGQSVVIRK